MPSADPSTTGPLQAGPPIHDWTAEDSATALSSSVTHGDNMLASTALMATMHPHYNLISLFDSILVKFDKTDHASTAP